MSTAYSQPAADYGTTESSSGIIAQWRALRPAQRGVVLNNLCENSAVRSAKASDLAEQYPTVPDVIAWSDALADQERAFTLAAAILRAAAEASPEGPTEDA